MAAYSRTNRTRNENMLGSKLECWRTGMTEMLACGKRKSKFVTEKGGLQIQNN